MKYSKLMRVAVFSMATFTTSSLQAQTPPGPLAFWDFNSNASPTNVTDLIGGYVGDIVNGAAYTAAGGGRSGQAGDRAMDFGLTDADQAVVINDPAFIGNLNGQSAADAITISFWVKWTTNIANSSAFWITSPSAANTQRGMHAETPFGNGNIPWDTGGTTANTQRIQATPANYVTNNLTANQFFTNQWRHFAFTKNGTFKEIWVDGRRVLTGNQATPLLFDYAQLVLGAEPTTFNNSMRGLMDDFAIFTGALNRDVIIALARGASPTNVVALAGDTDSDGMNDAYELNNGFNPNVAADAGQDADNDGSTNLQEYTRNTNPRDNDSDDDSFLDGVESNTGTWVSLTDTGTDPLVADTDRDGLLDGVERNTGTFVSATNPGTDPLKNDTDGDGFQDNDEVVFGSNPVLASSGPPLVAGQVSFWPLNEMQGTKTPDVVRGYDMNVIAMTSTNVVPGKFGNAFFFNGNNSMLERVSALTDEIPIYTKQRNFTLSMWVKGPPNQQDKRIFSESSTTGNQPLFNLGTHQTALDGSIDMYIRRDDNSTVGDHNWTFQMAYDNTNWHHVVWVQREDIVGQPTAQIFIDAVLDTGRDAPTPVRPLTANVTSIGGVRRGSDAAPSRQFVFSGLIDDVAVWKRALSTNEIMNLFTNGTPAAPAVLQPIQINRFLGDFPVAVNGDSVTLRWDVSAHATKIEIDQGIGDVTTNTVAGAGSKTIPITATKTYTLTITRGTEVKTASTTIRAVSGVETNWAILEDFEGYDTGAFPSLWWGDLGGNSTIIQTNGNKWLNSVGTTRMSILGLSQHTIDVGEERTLFARVLIRGNPADAVRSRFGLSDRALRSIGDTTDFGTSATTGEILGGVGPAVFISNEAAPPTLSPGARDGTFVLNGTLTWDPTGTNNLVTNEIYNVWLHVTNGAATDTDTGDKFTIYIQREGDTNRNLIIENFTSDRSKVGDPAASGGALTRPVLDKLFAGNDAVNGVFYDDFFISKTSLNNTIPRPLTGGSGGVPADPTILRLADGRVQITFTGGTLESSGTLAPGSWSTVTAATASPYVITPGTTNQFFRVRQ